MEKSIEDHIEKDKRILEDPTISPQMRRHTADELESLERYHKEHPEDHHDPTSFVMRIPKQTSVEFTRTNRSEF